MAAQDNGVNKGVSRHAILVGIDAYNPDHAATLLGCVNDVNEVSKQLETSIDNDSLLIHRFTASPNPVSKLPTEPKAQWPTHDNITGCFNGILERATQGHHVYFHFSGHGILAPAPKTYEHWPPGDYLALVLLNGEDASGCTELHSAELATIMKRMVDRGVGVTIVLDCCKSGGTLRRGQDSRRTPTSYLADRSRTQERPGLGDVQNHGMEEWRPASSGSLRAASMDTNWLVNPEGYAILAASDRTEGAYQVKFSNSSTQYGLLTYYLVEAFRELGGVGGSMEQLFESISVKVKDNRRHRQHKTQSPILKGNGKQLFFGCARAGCVGDFPVTRIVDEPRPDKPFRLHAGRAHGISEHDRFILRPLGLSLPAQELVAEVWNVRGITSDLRAVGSEDLAERVITGWLATPETRLALRQFPVRLNLRATQLLEWQEAMQRRPSLAEHVTGVDGAAQGGRQWAFMITQPDENTYEIHQSDVPHQKVTSVSVTEPRERAMHWLLDQIEHLARFKLLRDRTNRWSDGPEQEKFQNSFTVHLDKKIDNKWVGFSPGCHRTGDLFAACFSSECNALCVIPVLANEELSLRVENMEANQSLYFYVYDMTSTWEVDELHSSTRQEVPPRASGGNPCRQGIRFDVEDGRDVCEDVLKVFLTRQSTSFRTLTMPALGQSAGPLIPEVSQMRGNYRSEDWAVCTFRLRVSRNSQSPKAKLLIAG
jgi:hypothetical protein